MLGSFGLLDMIKSCMKSCLKKGSKMLIFDPKSHLVGPKWGPKGALGRPGSLWDAPGVLLEHFGLLFDGLVGPMGPSWASFGVPLVG